MSSEPSLFGAVDPAPPRELAHPAEPLPAPALTGWRLWTERVFLVVYVVFCIELGMLLAVLPWTRIWTDNNLLAVYPLLHSMARDNFLRGIVTGLGLVDIWLGIWEAVHYREVKPTPAPPPPPA